MKKLMFIITLMHIAATCLSSPLPDYPFIFARGYAAQELEPDTYTMTFKIRAREKNPTNALNRIELRTIDTTKILATNGVPLESISSSSIHKDHIRNYGANAEFQFLGYEVERSIEYTSSNLSAYDNILSHLLELEDIVDISSFFNRSDRRDIETGLLEEAVQDAVIEAEIIAKSSKQKIVRLRAISQSEFGNLNVDFGFERSARRVLRKSATYDQKVSYKPSTIWIEKEVSVIYEVTENK